MINKIQVLLYKFFSFASVIYRQRLLGLYHKNRFYFYAVYLFTRNCGGGGVEGAGFINFAYAGSFVGQPLVEEKK